MAGRVILFFDGGCRPNPGPIEVAVVGWGQTWFRDDRGSGDNNEAEWLALLFAVDIAVAAGVSDVAFVGDSAVVVNQASGRAPCRQDWLRPHLLAYRRAVTAFVHVAVRQVPRSKNLAGIALAQRRLR